MRLVSLCSDYWSAGCGKTRGPVATAVLHGVNGVFDTKLFIDADSHTNIASGSRHLLRAGLTTAF
jgi:hypothetical protein